MQTYKLPVFAALSMLASPLFPCPCTPIPSPCEAVHQAPIAFTATALRTVEQGRYTHTILRVVRSFHHQLPAEITFTSELLPGRQYLIYAYRHQDFFAPAFCQSALDLAEARDHLEFLDAFSQGRTPTTVSGTVEVGHSRQPLSDVRITITSPRGNYETTTDGGGHYSFQSIPPGDYQLQPQLAGFAPTWPDRELTVKSGACTRAYNLMAVDRRIHGTVRSSTGVPVEGVRVQLLRSVKDHTEVYHSTETDAAGNYIFHTLDSGEYFLGINIGMPPRGSSPHVPTYYPSAQHKRDAVPIFVPEAAAQQRYDFSEPGRLPVVTIRGKAVRADGTPAQGETSVAVSGEVIRSGPDGSFQFQHCEGFRYDIKAFAWHPETETTFFSETHSGVATKETQLHLILKERPIMEQSIR